jgi:Fasciclin domain
MFTFKSVVAGLAVAGATLAVQAKDIVDTAVAAGNFKTLATALQAAGLVDTLKGKGPFTVFAPTDEAFAKVPKEQLDALLKDKAGLTKVLTYHVVSGKVMAKDVKAGKVKTVQGSELTVTTSGGVMVDGAKVTATDIVADNGVIHVIDHAQVSRVHLQRPPRNGPCRAAGGAFRRGSGEADAGRALQLAGRELVGRFLLGQAALHAKRSAQVGGVEHRVGLEFIDQALQV